MPPTAEESTAAVSGSCLQTSQVSVWNTHESRERVFNLGDGSAMSGILVAGRRGATGEATLLALLMGRVGAPTT
jgi:hypothetical protein